MNLFYSLIKGKIPALIAIGVFSLPSLFAQERTNDNQPLCGYTIPVDACENFVWNPSFNTMYGPSGVPYYDAFHNLTSACPWTMPILTNAAGTVANGRHLGTPNLLRAGLMASNSVPNNQWGSQADEPGTLCDLSDWETGVQAYAGMFSYAQTLGPPNGTPVAQTDYREYIQQKLKYPLVNGATYNISIRVSLAEGSTRATTLGILFSEARPPLPSGGTGVLPGTAAFPQPQILIPQNTSKSNWVTYTFIYTHQGSSAQFMTIGNFKSDAALTTTGEISTVGPSTCTNCATGTYAYYYLDDISVYKGSGCCNIVPPGDPSACAYPANLSVYPQISGNLNSCLSNGVYSINNLGSFPAGSIFEWKFNTGSTTYTYHGSSVTIPLSVLMLGGTLTVSAAAPYTCINTASIAITGCCMPAQKPANTPTRYLATGASGANSASNMIAHFGTSSLLGVTLYINGVFTVDQDMTWRSTDVLLGENAQIVIAPNRTLTISRNSYLRACEKMWTGIEIAQASSTLIMAMGSRLEDAKVGIRSSNNGNFSLSDVFFNRNKTHIGVLFSTGVHPGIVLNSQFTCEDAMGNPISLKAPMSGEMTGTAIALISVEQFNVGVPEASNTSGNLIRDAEIGISASISSLNVKKTRFERLQNYAYNYSGNLITPSKGIGIYAGFPAAWGGSNVPAKVITVGDATNPAYGCTFDGTLGNGFNSGVGIYTFGNINLDAHRNSFSNLDYATLSNQHIGYTLVSGSAGMMYSNFILLNYNSLEHNNRGFYGVDNTRAHIQVLYNNLTLIEDEGISFANISPSWLTSIAVNYNVINGINLRRGISISGFFAPGISNNTISFTNFLFSAYLTGGPYYGIQVSNSIFAGITQNQVSRAATGQPFSLTNRQRLAGIFVETSPSSNICQNTLQRLGTSIYLKGAMPNSKIRLNKMYDSFTGVLLENANYENTASPLPQIPGDNEWYTIYGGNTTRRIEGTVTGVVHRWFWRNSSAAFNPNTHSVTPGSLFSTQQLITSMLINCTSDVPVNPLQPVWEEREAEFGAIVRNEITYPGAWRNTFGSADRQYAYSILKNDQILERSAAPEDEVFKAFLATAENQPTGIRYAAFEALSGRDSVSAVHFISLLPEGNTPEKALKQVLEIYLHRWMGETQPFSAEEQQLLETLAGSHFEEYGTAVYVARVMINGDAPAGVAQMPEQMTDAADKPNLSAIQVYPNPSRDKIYFELNGEADIFVFELFSLDGRLLLSKQFLSGEAGKGLEIRNLAGGIYVYSIQMSDGRVRQDKLLITD